MNITSKRFKEMRCIGNNIADEVSKLVPLLDEYIFFNDNHLEKYVLEYLKFKVSKRPLRAYTSWKYFEYLNHYSKAFSNKKLLFSTKLPLVFELVITIQYLHNHILDEKHDSKANNRPKLWGNLISSNLLKELLFSYLKTEINHLLLPQQQDLLRQAIGKLFNQVDIGQRLDKDFTTYKKWKEETMPDFAPSKWLEDDLCRNLMNPFIQKVKKRLKKGHHFTDVYFHRIYLTNVYFFRAIAEIMISFFPEVKEDKKEGLIRFSILQGYIVQIINDYADFAYSPDKNKREGLRTAGKKSTDFFADLYNFNITLPLIIHLQTDNRRKIEAYLEGKQRMKKLLHQYPQQIMQEIIDSGGIRKSISLTRDIAEAANSYLDKDNPASDYLIHMTGMANSNKFYSAFKIADEMTELAKTTNTLLSYILNGVSISVPLTFNTEFDRENNSFKIKQYMNGKHISIPNSSNAKKIISQEKRKNKDFSFVRQKLSSYFTEENKAKSKLVASEEAILQKNNISISKGHYIPYSIPPGESSIEKIIFLIFRNENDAEAVQAFLYKKPFSKENFS